MRGITLLTAFLSAAMALLPLVAAAQYTLNVTPGSLAPTLGEIPSGESHLVLQGSADASDLLALRDGVADIKSLDLNALKIEASTLADGDWFGRRHFPADAIPAYIFSCSPYESILLPAGTTIIEEGAFAGAALNAVTIPPAVAHMGDYAFAGSKIESADGGDALATAGKAIFANCSRLSKVDLSKSKLDLIPENCFAGCSLLSSLILPHSVKSIGSEAFTGTLIAELNLSQSSELADYSLSGMERLEKASAGYDSNLGNGVFLGDSSLIHTSGITEEIPDYTYSGCTSIDVTGAADGHTRLGEGAFAGCVCETLVLGPELQNIEARAFASMRGLKEVDAMALGGNVPDADTEAFAGIDTSRVELVVDADNADAWRAHPVWSAFRISPDSTTSVSTLDADSITLSLSNNILTIHAAAGLDRIAIYAFDGTLLALYAPKAQSWSTDIGTFATGAVTVVAESGTNRKSFKLRIE